MLVSHEISGAFVSEANCGDNNTWFEYVPNIQLLNDLIFA
jgi:hypothetical protein